MKKSTEKFLWVFLILLLIEIVGIYILTPTWTKSNTYEPKEIDPVKNNVFVKLICSSDGLFITSNSEMNCNISLRAIYNDVKEASFVIQAKNMNGFIFYGCQMKIYNVSKGSSSQLIPCKNEATNLSRPYGPYIMTLSQFKAKNPGDATLGDETTIIEFDRPVEVMSRNEELNIQISNNNLFIAAVALIVIAVLEFRKFVKNKF